MLAGEDIFVKWLEWYDDDIVLLLSQKFLFFES